VSTREKDMQAAAETIPVANLAERAAFAHGCAHRDRQVIALLNRMVDRKPFGDYATALILAIRNIEAGEHVP